MRFSEPFIDAHQHFWDLGRNPYPWLQDPEPIPFRYGDYSSLKRNYLPADLARDTEGFAPAKTVHIEAEWDRANPVDETRWLSRLAGETGRPSASVAHAALDRPDVEAILAQQAAFPLVRGIRHKPVTAASRAEARRRLPGSMDDERWRRGYALLARHGLSYDLQAPWWNLDQAADLAGDFPGTQVIINHTGLPVDRSPEGLAGWRAAMEQVAHCPNVAVKISGLGQRGLPWTPEANVPVIRDTIAIFGSDRCMFASNFPVDSLVANYETILAGFVAAIADRPDAERRQLLHDNAQRIYRL
ncbi:MAG: thioesterase [Ramlibacter sp.]|jgi:predicted TIM-barrel fold metal-dependent hydrolase|nr:thioesterase [Ramlibacter sp.]